MTRQEKTIFFWTVYTNVFPVHTSPRLWQHYNCSVCEVEEFTDAVFKSEARRELLLKVTSADGKFSVQKGIERLDDSAKSLAEILEPLGLMCKEILGES